MYVHACLLWVAICECEALAVINSHWDQTQNFLVHSDSGTHSLSYRLHIYIRNWVGVVTCGNAIASEPRFQVAGGLYW